MQSQIRDAGVREMIGYLDFFGVEGRDINCFPAVNESNVDTLIAHTGLWLSKKLLDPSFGESEAHASNLVFCPALLQWRAVFRRGKLLRHRRRAVQMLAQQFHAG
jgi:hypothetical protein